MSTAPKPPHTPAGGQAVDANAILAEIRDARDAVDDAFESGMDEQVVEPAQRLAEAVAELDKLLSNGGHLPDGWGPTVSPEHPSVD